MSNLDLEKIIFPNDNNTYIIRDAQAHIDLANKANKDGSNIIGPWTMNIIGHASQDIASTEKRQPGGVAELDQNGLIITSQLPSSVDEIIEGYYFNNKFYRDEQHTQEITGEASKIYIDLSTNQTYRWSGSTYVEISPSIALGVEHSTAGYGDWTNTAYLHATDANKISAAIASGLYKIAATSEGHIAGLTAVTKADITALGIPAQDTTYTQGTGISIDNNNVINHSNSVTAGTAKGDDSKTLTFGGTFTIPSITYDAQGHVTSKGTTTMTMPGNPNTDTTYTLGTSGNTVTLKPSTGNTQSITVPFATNSTNATKATQDASGNTITTTYRRLDNNIFDTISVTDLTAGDVVVTGVGRFTNGLYGNLTGNAATATKATQDESGNNIKANYAASFSISDHTITLKNKNGASLGTVTVPDNNTTYSLSASGESVVLTGSNSSTSSTTLSTLINGLSTGSSTPVDTDYYVSQYANGGSTTTSYHRRPMAALWNYIKGKGDSVYTPYKGDMKTAIGQNTPAAATKTYWESNTNIPTTSVNTAYNSSGTEYALLFSKGGTNNYGSILRWGYSTPYLEILRRYQGNWQSTDWEKIYAGYADTAGTATKATQDGSGNVITSTYLPLSGGTMTGQIVLASSALKTNDSTGWTMNQYGNLVHQRATTTDYWAIANNAGTYKFQVYYETGAVTAAGNVTAPRFIGTADYAASMAEANLTWGGKNFSGSYGCIDACLMDELGANRFQFIKADAITVEYTRDGGTTWTDYGATDAQKKQIFAQGGGLVIGKADSTNKATEHPGLYQLRITIDTGVANIYSYLNKFVIYVTSSGSANCACKIQKALQSTPTTFVDHTDWTPISGWSGYNVLNTSYLATYGNTASSQYGRVRFVFKDGEGGNTSYNGLIIAQIKAFGGVGWLCPSTMAKTGHLYSYDQDQNAVFPNLLQAPYLRGTTKMTVSNGKISQLATGTTMLFSDGVAISNPTTSNDVGWIRVLGTGESDTIMEIATGDDGGAGEQIVVRQYNTSSAITNEATLLDKSGNTTFPKNVTATKFIGALQGNADTATSATTATTATNLSGFTNTTSTGTAIDSATQNGHVYVTRTSGIYSQNDGAAFVQAYSTSWVAQIYQDYRTGQIALRGKNNGTWQSWRKVWDSVNLKSETAAASGTTLSLVTTGEKATWNAKASSDTKNTAGSTDTSSKIYLIGATSQAANPQTYSQDTAYVGTDGCLYSGGSKVLTAHQDISGKVNKSGDTMSGGLTIGASNSYSSYNEGIRINAGARTYATLLMGGTAGTTSGTNDGAFWLGVYNTGTTARRLMIAHNGSTATGTYFYASSASNVSPSLAIGTDLKVVGVSYLGAGNAGTTGGISLYSTSSPLNYGIAMRTTTNGGKHGGVQGDWAIYFSMNNQDNRGWIFRRDGSMGVASVDTTGNAVFNGYVGIGGNTTNTSGVRQVYNSTTKSLDFVFVA